MHHFDIKNDLKLGHRLSLRQPASESVDWEIINEPLRGSKGGYRFVPIEEGTQFTLVADVKLYGFYKFLGPFFGWMLRRQHQTSVERLRQILESE